jgi:hypothetical protein
METPPPVSCTLLGEMRSPASACRAGTATLITKLAHGRPRPPTPAPPAPAPPAPTPPSPPLPPPRATIVHGAPASEALRARRAHLLLDGTTYNATDVPLLPHLPVLTASNVLEHAEWHAYVRTVYGDGVQWPLDLNNLSWFYWSAPLAVPKLLLCDWIEPGLAEAAYGTPWTGGMAAWTWGPEHLVSTLPHLRPSTPAPLRPAFGEHPFSRPPLRPSAFFASPPLRPQPSAHHLVPPPSPHRPLQARRAGFLVHRPPSTATELSTARRIEVMRIGPIEEDGFFEVDEIWFYHAVGSVPRDDRASPPLAEALSLIHPAPDPFSGRASSSATTPSPRSPRGTSGTCRCRARR